MPNNTSQKTILSRATLDISYHLLRKQDPQLALTVRNILFQNPIEKTNEKIKNKNTDQFIISLDTFTVRKIIETLSDILEQSKQTHTDDNTSLFRPVLIQSIIDEWTILAKIMFIEYKKSKPN